MWVCGLKPFRSLYLSSTRPVAPYVGVWIETEVMIWVVSRICRTLCGCVDWNKSASTLLRSSSVAPYVGVWIETLKCCIR